VQRSKEINQYKTPKIIIFILRLGTKSPSYETIRLWIQYHSIQVRRNFLLLFSWLFI